MTEPPRPARRRDVLSTAMSRDECLALLPTQSVGRLAFADGDGQQIVPVNFAFLDGSVFFRTLPGGYLARLARGTHDVAFEVDDLGTTDAAAWNVTVKGIVEHVEDRATINRVLRHSALDPWAGGIRPMVMRVTPMAVAGRRVPVPPG